MDALHAIFIICAALIAMGSSLLYQRRRDAAIRAMAARLGLQYIGSALPRSLTLSGTPFDYVSAVWNAIDGEPHGVRVIAFDCRVGTGKGSWRRTVIAVEDDAAKSKSTPLCGNLETARSGRWNIYFRPKAYFEMRIGQLMPVQELEACLKSLPN